MPSMYAIVVPFASAVIGAIAGAAVSWLALVRTTKNEWKRKQAQARRALQVEMLMNA